MRKNCFTKLIFTSIETAITKLFHKERTDRREGITFKKSLIKFYYKGERNKCKQRSRKRFSDWKLLVCQHGKSVRQ